MTPTLATERLVLRAPEAADFEPYAAFFASDRAVWEDGPLTARRRLDGVRHRRRRLGAARLRLLLARSTAPPARYLGEVGLYQPAHYPEPEIGWILMAEAEGRGLAREAALAVRAWAYAQPRPRRRSSATSPAATPARSASPSASAPSPIRWPRACGHDSGV